MRESIITGVDAPPVFELAEHIFDFMALAIKRLIWAIGILRLAFEGMQGRMPRLIRALRNQSAS